MDDGDDGGGADSESSTEEATIGDGDEGLNDLKGTATGVGVGVDPGIHADADDIEEIVGDDGGDDEEQAADEDIATLTGAEVEHGDKDGEEQGASAEIALRDKDEKGEAPNEEERGDEDEGLALAFMLGHMRETFGEVGGEEDDE
jgi:hypothetical protein